MGNWTEPELEFLKDVYSAETREEELEFLKAVSAKTREEELEFLQDVYPVKTRNDPVVTNEPDNISEDGLGE